MFLLLSKDGHKFETEAPHSWKNSQRKRSRAHVGVTLNEWLTEYVLSFWLSGFPPSTKINVNYSYVGF